MRKFLTTALIGAGALGLAACGTTVEQRAATGALTGALVAGPMGALVGGAAGAVMPRGLDEQVRDR